MRRLLTVALIGLAVASTTTVASAQGRGGRKARGGKMDSTMVGRMDSLRAARGGRAQPDSLRAKRLDSLRAAGGDPRKGAEGRRGGPAEIANARSLMAGIQLNEQEKANVKTINQKYAEQLRQLRSGADGKPQGIAQDPEARKQLLALGEKQKAELRGALTSEHQAQFDANVAKARGRGRGGKA